MWIYQLGMWFSGEFGSAGLMVVFDDLRGVFQLSWVHDSVINALGAGGKVLEGVVRKFWLLAADKLGRSLPFHRM